MKYLKNKKGQGSDTFKLLIAAVVAMVILGIVTGVFQNIWTMVGGITCVSSPIDEMVTKIQKAEAGIQTATGVMCMYNGERFGQDALINKISNLKNVEFDCIGAAVCTPPSGPIDVSDHTNIVAKADAKFKALIGCDSEPDGYHCKITITNV